MKPVHTLFLKDPLYYYPLLCNKVSSTVYFPQAYFWGFHSVESLLLCSSGFWRFCCVLLGYNNIYCVLLGYIALYCVLLAYGAFQCVFMGFGALSAGLWPLLLFLWVTINFIGFSVLWRLLWCSSGSWNHYFMYVVTKLRKNPPAPAFTYM